MDRRAHRLRAVRPNHWAGNVRPLPGPDGLLWLRTEREGLLGLDPVLGDRRVDQPVAGGTYSLFTESWPHVVRRRDAPPRPVVAIARGHVVTTVDGREVGKVALPEELRKGSHARLGHGAAWILRDPSHGEAAMSIACFDVEAQTFGPVHALDFATHELAVDGSRIALFDEPSGRVHLYDRDRRLRVVQHEPSACWGKVAIDGDELAIVSHQRGSRPGAVVAVGATTLREGAEPAMRRFALHTQGATDVTFLDGFLAIHQYGDVTLVSRDALRESPAGELALEIEDLATRPPPPAHTARVSFVGASTGFGLVESDTLGRLRFQVDTERPVAVDDVLALDDVEPGVVRRWHLVGAGPQPLDPASRCLEPAAWSDFEEARRSSGGR